MNLTGNKKAQTLDGTGFDVVDITHKENQLMNNITHISAIKQAQETQYEQFCLYLDTVRALSEEMQSLCFCIVERTDKHSAENNLAKILFKMLSELRDDSIEEGEILETKECAA